MDFLCWLLVRCFLKEGFSSCGVWSDRCSRPVARLSETVGRRKGGGALEDCRRRRLTSLISIWITGINSLAFCSSGWIAIQ